MLNDEKLAELADRFGSREALSWLQSSAVGKANTLGLLNHKDSLELIEYLYRIGAENIVVIKGHQHVDGDNAGKLILTLPPNSAKRAAIFAWNASWAVPLGFEPDIDRAQ